MAVNETAIMRRDTVDVIAQKVRQFQEKGELQLPANYSPENAMKSAWLILQSAVDRDQKPVLQVCTKDSIANALLDMVVQGLNPSKKQGYFIAYGKNLVFQRSYFGTMAVAMQVDDDIADIIAEVVYEGDVFKFRINRGKKEVSDHEQTLESINSKKIKAAYCIIIDQCGQVKKTEIMTFEEIKQAWKQSKMNPIDESGNVKASSTHGKFIAEMCKKTVINKACKPIINSSNDSYLFRESFSRTSEMIAEEDAAQEIAKNANAESIDVDYSTVNEQTASAEAAAAAEDPKPLAETEQGVGQMTMGGTGGPDF